MAVPWPRHSCWRRWWRLGPRTGVRTAAADRGAAGGASGAANQRRRESPGGRTACWKSAAVLQARSCPARGHLTMTWCSSCWCKRPAGAVPPTGRVSCPPRAPPPRPQTGSRGLQQGIARQPMVCNCRNVPPAPASRNALPVELAIALQHCNHPQSLWGCYGAGTPVSDHRQHLPPAGAARASPYVASPMTILDMGTPACS